MALEKIVLVFIYFILPNIFIIGVVHLCLCKKRLLLIYYSFAHLFHLFSLGSVQLSL